MLIRLCNCTVLPPSFLGRAHSKPSRSSAWIQKQSFKKKKKKAQMTRKREGTITSQTSPHEAGANVCLCGCSGLNVFLLKTNSGTHVKTRDRFMKSSVRCCSALVLFVIRVLLFCSVLPSLPVGDCVSPFSVFTCSRNGAAQAHAPIVENYIIDLQVWRTRRAGARNRLFSSFHFLVVQPVVFIQRKKHGYIFCPPLAPREMLTEFFFNLIDYLM